MEFVKCERIEKGWSDEKKYRATDAAGNVYLLRVTSPEKSEDKRLELDLMRRATALGVHMSRPVSYEERKDGIYFVQSWVDGEDASDVIPGLPEEEQYRYGLDAGRALGLIHTLPVPERAAGQYESFRERAERKLRAYEECPLHYENGECFTGYVRENMHIMSGRPVAMRHGDFHIGNMMIDREGILQVIDFNRCGCGDPWKEFDRIVWSAQVSPAFASGTVDGYFPDGVPEEFWRVLAVYIAANALSSLPWAIPFGDGEIATMRALADGVLRWYDGFRREIPSWYCGKGK